MEPWQNYAVLGFLIYNVVAFVQGLWEVRKKNNFCGVSLWLYPMGAYVWADAVVFGLFWVVVSTAILWINSWYLFLATFFIFSAIRHHGETIYWFNHQFSTVRRYPIKGTLIYKIFPDEYTCMFVYQILWQCATAISTVLAVYFSYKWISTL